MHWLTVLLLMILCASAWGASFPATSDPTMAEQQRWGAMQQGYVADGCWHGTSASTSVALPSCRAFALETAGPAALKGFEELQARTLTYSGGDGTYWLGGRWNPSTPMAGWTCSSGLHYCWIKAETPPVIPSGLVLLGKTTVSTNAITAFVIMAPWSRSTPYLVPLGTTLTFGVCPTHGPVPLFDANESTSGAVRFTGAGCREVFPEWWGADSSGSTNAGAAINRALTAVSASPRPPPLVFTGAYLVTESLVLKSGAHLLGRGGELRAQMNAVGPSQFMTAMGDVIANVTIENLRFINLGSPSGTELTGIYGFTTGGFTNLIIRNNYLYGFGQGISVSDAGVPLERYQPPGAAPMNGDHDFLGRKGLVLITGNVIEHSLEETPPGAGLSGIYNRMDYAIISHNRIQDYQMGILASFNHGTIAANMVLNAWYDNGIYCSGCTFVTMTGNYIELADGDGIAVNGGRNLTLTGNTIVQARNGGIRLQSSERIIVSSNLIHLGTSGNHCIRGHTNVDEPASGWVTLVGNICRGPGSQLGTPIVFLQGLTEPHDITIADNQLLDMNTLATPPTFKQALIFIQGAPVQRNKIIGNSVHNAAPILGVSGSAAFSGYTAQRDNVLHFSDGTVWNTGDDYGEVRFAVGAAGAVSTTHILGVVSAVTRTGVGVYRIDFPQKVLVTSFSGTATNTSGTIPWTLRMDPMGSGIADTAACVASITVRTLDNANPPLAIDPVNVTIQLHMNVRYQLAAFNGCHS